MQITPPPSEALYRKYVVAVPMDLYPADSGGFDQVYQMPWPLPQAEFIDRYPTFVDVLPDLHTINAGDVLIASRYDGIYSGAMDYVFKDIKRYLLTVVEVAQALACTSLEISWEQKDKADSVLGAKAKGKALVASAEAEFKAKIREVSEQMFSLSYRGQGGGTCNASRGLDIVSERKLANDEFLDSLIRLAQAENAAQEITLSLTTVQESFRNYAGALNARARIISGSTEIDFEKTNVTSLAYKVTCKFG